MAKAKLTSPTIKKAKTTNPSKKRASSSAKKLTAQPSEKTARNSPRRLTVTKVSLLLAASIILTFIASLELYEANRLNVSAPRLTQSQSLLNVKKKGPLAVGLPSLRSLDKCQQGVALNVIAHQDDDLLFMNPAIANEIESGKCIRTVYVTAGDDGQSANYWQGREEGAKAAYASMYQRADNWQSTKALISGHEFEVATLNGVPSMSLMFLHLPDGSPSGEGFGDNRNETLQKLRTGSIKSIHAIGGKTSYTTSELIHSLSVVMNLDRPETINTQAYGAELEGGDHSDHQAVGYFTDQARHSYRGGYTFSVYLGYQSGHLPVNLNEADSAMKQAVFATYEQYDTAICTTLAGCRNANTYTAYLQRQYVYKSEPVAAQDSPSSSEPLASSVNRRNICFENSGFIQIEVPNCRDSKS